MPKVPGFIQPVPTEPNWELLAKHRKLEASRAKRNKAFHLRPRTPRPKKVEDKQ